MPWQNATYSPKKKDAVHVSHTVDSAIAEYLQVLRIMVRGCFGVIEGVDQAGAFDRFLLNAVDHGWFLDPGRFEDRRRDVNDRAELRVGFVGLLHVLGP